LGTASLPERQTAGPFRLSYDYTIGFALSDRASVSEQRIQDGATRRELHAFLRSFVERHADRFPALAVLSECVWIDDLDDRDDRDDLDDRDDQFTASLATLIAGLSAARPAAPA
jgi:hypothetical protein